MFYYFLTFVSNLPWFKLSTRQCQLCDPLIPVSLPTVFQGSGGLTSPCTSPLSGSSTTLVAITPSVFVSTWQIFPLLKYLFVKRQVLASFMENPVFQLKLKSWGGVSRNRAQARACRHLCFHPAGWFHHWNMEEWEVIGILQVKELRQAGRWLKCTVCPHWHDIPV